MAGQDPPYENDLLIGRGGSAPLPTSPRASRKGRGWAAQRIQRWRIRSFRRIAKRRRAPSNRRPGGRRTGGAPFFDAAGCRIEKSRQTCRRQICPGTREFSLVTFLTRAYGARPRIKYGAGSSGRLRRSRRTRRSATKKVTRAKRGSSAVAFDGYRYAQPILLTELSRLAARWRTRAGVAQARGRCRDARAS